MAGLLGIGALGGPRPKSLAEQPAALERPLASHFRRDAKYFGDFVIGIVLPVSKGERLAQVGTQFRDRTADVRGALGRVRFLVGRRLGRSLRERVLLQSISPQPILLVPSAAAFSPEVSADGEKPHARRG